MEGIYVKCMVSKNEDNQYKIVKKTYDIKKSLCEKIPYIYKLYLQDSDVSINTQSKGDTDSQLNKTIFLPFTCDSNAMDIILNTVSNTKYDNFIKNKDIELLIESQFSDEFVSMLNEITKGNAVIVLKILNLSEKLQITELHKALCKYLSFLLKDCDKKDICEKLFIISDV